MAAARVLTVCGSIQPTSANRRALDVVGARLVAAGASIQEAVAVDLVPAFDPGRDHAADAVERLRSQIGSSDAVVVATPEYAGGMAGALKNALDWIVGSGELYGRPVAVISAGTTGGEHARRDLARTLTWQGGHVVAELGIAAPRTKADATGRYIDAATLAALETLADGVLHAPSLEPAARLALVGSVLARLGIGPEHISPMI